MQGYAIEAQLTGITPIGLVPEGLRLDVSYAGTVTDGPMNRWPAARSAESTIS